MKPNKHIIFPLDNVEDLAQIMPLPYGDLIKIGMNRWNGNVVMSFQDHPVSRFYIRLIVSQLSDLVDMFDEEAYREARHGLLSDDFEDRCGSFDFDDFPREIEEVA